MRMSAASNVAGRRNDFACMEAPSCKTLLLDVNRAALLQTKVTSLCVTGESVIVWLGKGLFKHCGFEACVEALAVTEWKFERRARP